MPLNLFQRLFGSKTAGSEEHCGLLIESMLIMIAADGIVEDTEMDRFMELVLTSDELRGVNDRSIDEHVQQAFSNIKRDGLKRRLGAIAVGLPSRAHRLAALRMAFLVGSGDGALIDREAELIEQMRIAFDLSSKDLEAVRQGDSTLDELGGAGDAPARAARPPEQYFIETLLLMAAADGILEPKELDKFGHQLANRPEFSTLTPEQAGSYMDNALRSLQRDGVEERLRVIASGLTEPSQRLAAFRLALEMCVADGVADTHERTLLKLLQAKFELSDDLVTTEIHKVLGAP
jgi:tellurite resistance protein